MQAQVGAVFVVLAVAAIVGQISANGKTFEQTKNQSRVIPADALRDFPGFCFASTQCKPVKPGESWDLYPFCGRSTCVTTEPDKEGLVRLLEQVEDCAQPKHDDKCKLSEAKTDKEAAYPKCCPVYECEAGHKLEYPDPAKAAPAAAASTAKPAVKKS